MEDSDVIEVAGWKVRNQNHGVDLFIIGVPEAKMRQCQAATQEDFNENVRKVWSC